MASYEKMPYAENNLGSSEPFVGLNTPPTESPVRGRERARMYSWQAFVCTVFLMLFGMATAGMYCAMINSPGVSAAATTGAAMAVPTLVMYHGHGPLVHARQERSDAVVVPHPTSFMDEHSSIVSLSFPTLSQTSNSSAIGIVNSTAVAVTSRTTTATSTALSTDMIVVESSTSTVDTDTEIQNGLTVTSTTLTTVTMDVTTSNTVTETRFDLVPSTTTTTSRTEIDACSMPEPAIQTLTIIVSPLPASTSSSSSNATSTGQVTERETRSVPSTTTFAVSTAVITKTMTSIFLSDYTMTMTIRPDQMSGGSSSAAEMVMHTVVTETVVTTVTPGAANFTATRSNDDDDDHNDDDDGGVPAALTTMTSLKMSDYTSTMAITPSQPGLPLSRVEMIMHTIVTETVVLTQAAETAEAAAAVTAADISEAETSSGLSADFTTLTVTPSVTVTPSSTPTSTVTVTPAIFTTQINTVFATETTVVGSTSTVYNTVQPLDATSPADTVAVSALHIEAAASTPEPVLSTLAPPTPYDVDGDLDGDDAMAPTAPSSSMTTLVTTRTSLSTAYVAAANATVSTLVTADPSFSVADVGIITTPVPMQGAASHTPPEQSPAPSSASSIPDGSEAESGAMRSRHGAFTGLALMAAYAVVFIM